MREVTIDSFESSRDFLAIVKTTIADRCRDRTLSPLFLAAKRTYDSEMTQRISISMLPQFLETSRLPEGIAVVIDVLRASTTIVHALAVGADAIVPCETIEEAWAIKRSLEQQSDVCPSDLLLGGERKGVPIEGFDLGNSPLSYQPGIVGEKTIIFTTTNGTKALRRCESAARVLVGAFVNRRALVDALLDDGRPIHLVCAGTDGHLTAEDILFAGAVAADLMEAEGHSIEAGDDVQTQMAIDFWRARSADEASFRETIRTSRGGRNLERLGMEADIDRASQCDLFALVPEWRRDGNRIVRGR